jgi:DNA polymerase-3 subunit alpha
MVTYVTGITNVNPLDLQTPLRALLKPERPSAPDIDMDYADNRRDEVIEYAAKIRHRPCGADRYLWHHARARRRARRRARARLPLRLGRPHRQRDPLWLARLPMTLERALEENPELKKMYKGEREVKEIIDLGKKIEGCARHVGVHAAGVVIAPRPLVDYSPLQRDPKGGKSSRSTTCTRSRRRGS